ncbi:MAG: HAD family hydrolase [Clostridia bacterium]|nr:HAD family hydrolase [Clostridia bacterium]NCC77067.1 HAD family hydrolase [Clostridia bacterium]
MSNPAQALIDMEKKHDYMICVDSDGCAFDAMEIKQKECFAPNFINAYDLQPVSKYARECWEFVNLYSVDRGCNRFIAIIKALDLLGKRKEVIARGFKVPDTTGLKEWVKVETKLGNPALEAAIEKTGDPALKQAIRYSIPANKSVEEIVHGVPPFPLVRESLAKGAAQAEMVVVSATPAEALQREWTEHGLIEYMTVVAGQEVGTKKEQIRAAMSGRYDPAKVIMVGDAMGDLEAAKGNGVLFYPINPGAEDASWIRFYNEAFDKFIDGTFAGSYQEALIEEFKTYLPVTPPWES